LEPWLSVYLMVTVKIQMLQKHFQFPNSTKMISKSANLMRPQQIHNEYDALQNWTPIILVPLSRIEKFF